MSVHDRSPEYTYAVGEAFYDCDDLFIMFIILFVLPVSSTHTVGSHISGVR